MYVWTCVFAVDNINLYHWNFVGIEWSLPTCHSFLSISRQSLHIIILYNQWSQMPIMFNFKNVYTTLYITRVLYEQNVMPGLATTGMPTKMCHWFVEILMSVAQNRVFAMLLVNWFCARIMPVSVKWHIFLNRIMCNINLFINYIQIRYVLLLNLFITVIMLKCNFPIDLKKQYYWAYLFICTNVLLSSVNASIGYTGACFPVFLCNV